LPGHDSIRPIDILKFSPEVSAASSDYLFLSSVEHINRLKRGPFNEHSPILYNIATTVPNWGKVNTGLMKMYQAEVLEKHTVVQHFYFGGLLPWTKRGTRSPLPSSGDRPQEKEDVDEEEVFSLTTGATKVPWVDTGDRHPVATTVAPWASQPTRALPNTSAPWATGDFGRPGRAVPASHPFARQHGHDLASTGSAAAMSSPLGAISQPIIRNQKEM
jgi:serine/threonine-protein phosphatase 2A activator